MHRRHTLAAALLMVVGINAGCGKEGGNGERLSNTSATALRAGLDQVQQAVRDRECQSAASGADELRQRAADLRRGDADLRRALADGFAHLETLVQERCAAAQVQTTGPTTPPVAETGPTGDGADENPTGKEKPPKPGKGKGRNKDKKKDEQGGGEENLDGNQRQDSGGAAE